MAVVDAEMEENPYVPKQQKEEFLLQRLHLLTKDLNTRGASEYVTARDINEYIIVPETEEKSCAFVDLGSVKNAVDKRTKKPCD